jgi:hypothetical protein
VEISLVASLPLSCSSLTLRSESVRRHNDVVNEEHINPQRRYLERLVTGV